jgi:DNA-binding NtrC family response regulator
MVQLTPPPARVLVAETEPSRRRELARALLQVGQEVLTAESAEVALALARSERVEVALVSASLLQAPGGLLEGLHRLTTPPEVIAVGLASDAAPMVARGAWGWLERGPSLAEQAATAARRASEQHRLKEELKQRPQREEGPIFVGQHRAVRQALEQARRVASGDRPAHLWGEAGTGKRLLARLIHGLRGGGAADWVELPGEGLDKAELERVLQQARSQRRTTIYLSQIDRLATSAQLLLEQWLEASEGFAPLLTSSRGNLFQVSQSGGFRPELHARVAVRQIHLIPLRQKKDDIPALAHHFLLQATQRNQSEVKRIGPEAMRMIRGQPWPGNARQLRLTIERAVLSCHRTSLFPGDLSPCDPSENHEVVMTTKNDFTGLSLPTGWDELPYADAKERALDSFHAAYLGALLRRTGGNISEAARRAGLDRSNFRRVLKRYGNPLAPKAGEGKSQG